MTTITGLPANSRFANRAWQSIRHNPQLRSTEMWLIWLVPTVMVPTLRYMEDTHRESKDRLKLSIRDFFAYLGGVAFNFSLMPLSAVVFNQFKATRKKAGVLSVLTGSVASATYSGLAANKFAGWINNRLFSPQGDSSARAGGGPAKQVQFRQTAQASGGDSFHRINSAHHARFRAFAGLKPTSEQ